MNQNPEQPFLKLDPEMRRIAVTIGYMLIIAGFAAALKLLWPVISTFFKIMSPFIVALVVAYVFNPVVNFFQKRLKLSRVAGVAFLYLMILLVVGVFIAIVIPILTVQVKAAYQGTKHFVVDTALPFVEEKVLAAEPDTLGHEELRNVFAQWTANAPAEVSQRFDAWLEEQPRQIAPKDFVSAVGVWDEEASTASSDSPNPYDDIQESAAAWAAGRAATYENSHDLPARLEAWMAARDISVDSLVQKAFGSEGVRTAATSAATEGAGLLTRVVSGIAGFISGVVGSVTFLIFAILVSFYLLIDFGKFRGIIEILMPDKYEPKFFDVAKKLDVAVGGFIRGQMITAMLVGLIAFIGLTVLGLGKYALLIACIAAIGNLIPYFGPVMGATPAILYMLFSDAHGTFQAKLLFAGLVIGLFAMIQVIEGFVFQPKIVGPNAQLHPVIVIIALAVGAQFGIMGMIIAVPAAAMLRVVFEEFFWNKRMKHWQFTTGKVHYDDEEPKSKKKDKQPVSKGKIQSE
ncbi:AI-2E family transporter [bacterium]|nr:AI-2E family transporter [bacterium]